MAEPKFFILMSSGEQIQVDIMDFNNLKGRVSKGQTNGWYTQRGPSVGKDRHNWSIQFKDLAGFWCDTKAPEENTSRLVDINKHLPPVVGTIEEPKKPDCSCDWNDETTYGFVTQIVNGINRYYKQCNKCESKSNLIKKREVELAMVAQGKKIEDVPELKDK